MEEEHECGASVKQLIVATVLLVAGMLVEHTGAGLPSGKWSCAVIYLCAFLPVGLGVMREAVECSRKGDIFNEFTLMSVAAIGAFAIGEMAEAVAVMLLYQIGEALQDRAVDRARDNIKSMMDLRPDHAWLVRGEEVTRCQPADVAVGDIIEVRDGERVPLDGTLLAAEADFDTAALTGESMPRTIAAGGEVLAGMIATGHTVRLQTTRPAGQSAIARILNMVEEASERKAPTELFIRRFARVYTPAVFGLAVLVVLLPYIGSLAGLLGEYHFSQWLSRSLVFLVIACPCALVISVPLSYYVGIGAASRRGILFKGGNTLDAMTSIDTVAFDKTGTLTTGRFAVSQTHGLSPADFAQVAAMEQKSSHPIAQAVVEYAKKQGVEPREADAESVAGYGLSCDGWLVGAPRLLEKHHVACPDYLAGVCDTVVAVARDGQYKGCILLADTVKDDAAEAIRSLRRHTVILSGDKQTLVDRLVGQLHADEGYGDLLPQHKAEHIEALQRRHHKVAFVGDGINDAPVLALSDVGIAMGKHGADMAVETADVVIATDKPSRVATAMSIARRTRRIVAQNIVFALGLKVCFMVLGVCGIANIWMAVFADTGVTLLAVLNSMRIFAAKE